VRINESLAPASTSHLVFQGTVISGNEIDGSGKRFERLCPRFLT
jgi:hypothetical protein